MTGLNRGNPNRATFLFDNFNLPEIINYLAAGIVSQDFDRMVKNYYLYRDTEGTRLWTMFPWDTDLSFGVSALQCDHIGLNVAQSNDPAIRAYRRGGFEIVAEFHEGTITRRT